MSGLPRRGGGRSCRSSDGHGVQAAGTSDTAGRGRELRLLVHAPFGRDGATLVSTARTFGLDAEDCRSGRALRGSVAAGFGALVLTQEALSDADGAALADVLREQPSWSAAPVMVLLADVDRPPAGLLRLRAIEPRLELMILQRPARARSIASALKVLLAARERQYVVRDQIAELDDRRQHLQFLLAELDHRVKNTLAKVIGITRLSGDAVDVAEFRDTFANRIEALVRAHDTLAGDRDRQMTLLQVAEEALAPFLNGNRSNVGLSGPKVPLWPKDALTLAMALHELATNAAKHGALSAESGTIEVRWWIDRGETDTLVLTWREAGGPPVVVPRRQSFGTRMLGEIAPSELRGEAELVFAPTGLEYRLRVPVKAEGLTSSQVATSSLRASAMSGPHGNDVSADPQ